MGNEEMDFIKNTVAKKKKRKEKKKKHETLKIGPKQF
jgi:hypothetical protein